MRRRTRSIDCVAAWLCAELEIQQSRPAAVDLDCCGELGPAAADIRECWVDWPLTHSLTRLLTHSFTNSAFACSCDDWLARCFYARCAQTVSRLHLKLAARGWQWEDLFLLATVSVCGRASEVSERTSTTERTKRASELVTRHSTRGAKLDTRDALVKDDEVISRINSSECMCGHARSSLADDHREFGRCTSFDHECLGQRAMMVLRH